MSVPISDIVNVNIGVAPTPVGSAGFGNLLFITDEVDGTVDETERVTRFQTLAGVQEKFDAGTHPEVTAAATAYFAQVPTPLNFYVGAILANATSATLTSEAHADLATLQAVTAGGFTVTVDGGALTIAAVDLSAAADLPAAAALVTVALSGQLAGTVCSYDAGNFVITSPTTGVASTMTVASADADGLADALGLLASNNAVVLNGVDNETPAIALAACREFDATFSGVVTDKKFRDSSSAVEVSDWCQATKVIFGHTTNDVNTLSPALAVSTLAGQLAAKANGYTLSNYSSSIDEYPSCSALGRIFTTNYGGTDTTITLMFKKLPTITVEDLGPSAKGAMESVNCNAFLKVGNTSIYSDSAMADGGWADSVHGLMWLEEAIQLNVFNLLYGHPTKVPYTDTGIGMVASQVSLALEQGVRNGLLAAGNDANGDYLPAGFEVTSIPVALIPASDKGNRVYNGITFKAVGAGALHGVTISGTFNE